MKKAITAGDSEIITHDLQSGGEVRSRKARKRRIASGQNTVEQAGTCHATRNTGARKKQIITPRDALRNFFINEYGRSKHQSC
ncbi:hypothetical protein [Treponema parvum]|uniref:hypothetical protein n=1 Tax=Treponema parvum TaxID=138851 RepID=UPI001AEBD2FE|nr:hypothetical protein [Treponema parvum]QTQ16278.1 hypothetical protein HXT04_06020 [Treponema parvum]